MILPPSFLRFGAFGLCLLFTLPILKRLLAFFCLVELLDSREQAPSECVHFMLGNIWIGLVHRYHSLYFSIGL